MKGILAASLLLSILCPTMAWAQATMKNLELGDGYRENNTIGSPLCATGSAPPLEIGTITAGYNRREKVVRRGGGNFFTKGPEYKIDTTIDLAEMLAVALQAESSAMGFRRAPEEEEGWHIEGVLSEIYLESRQVYMGATLFYGFMNVELEVRQGSGSPHTMLLRIHSYHGAYNAGMGRQDEAKESLALLLVEGAQEILSRLNRSHFQARAHPDIEQTLASLESSSLNDLHRFGLAGSRSATPDLMALIARADDEDRRSALIDAVGRLGAPEAVSVLADWYRSEEDEDCRWSTIKALDYIGGEQALAVIRDEGVDDDHEAIERLAKRILGS